MGKKEFKNESDFTSWMCDCLKAAGAQVIALVGTGVQRSGLPDRYVSHVKWQGFIEVKRDKTVRRDIGKLLRTDQRLVLNGLARTGTRAVVVSISADEDGPDACLCVYTLDESLDTTRQGWVLKKARHMSTLLCLSRREAGHQILDALRASLGAYRAESLAHQCRGGMSCACRGGDGSARCCGGGEG